MKVELGQGETLKVEVGDMVLSLTSVPTSGTGTLQITPDMFTDWKLSVASDEHVVILRRKAAGRPA